MKGDNITIFEDARKIANMITTQILPRIEKNPTRFIISVSGESGSGKSVLGKAISEKLSNFGFDTIVLGQDDYFILPPKSNDLKRREDPDWIGPHVEVDLDLMEKNITEAIEGKDEITKPLIDYYENSIHDEKISLQGIKVIIAEGTYTSLLRHVDVRIFIDRDWRDTFIHRIIRNRGTEAGDPFIERILSIEHKIIAGHRQLADYVILKDYSLIEKE